MVIADRAGISALSMRNVAKELGYEVMSLYNHVADKDAILDGLVELVAGEIEPVATGEWRAATKASVSSARRALLRHPWAVGLWWERRTGPTRLAYLESLLRGMRDAGFPADVAYHGYHALLMHITGFTAQEHNLPSDNKALGELAAAFIKRIPADQYPYLVEHMTQHVDKATYESDEDFTFVLDLILDGLERAASRGT